MVSIIVPIYNREKTLYKCIDSILNQTYRNIELILVDDGSTDASLSICEKAACVDSRVKVYHKPNGGVSSARNIGIKMARGEYLQFVDSDDYIANNMTELLVRCVEKNNTQLAVCGLIYVSKDKKNMESFPKIPYVDAKLIASAIPNFVSKYFLNSVCNKLYLKDFVKYEFIESMSLGEDLIFNFNYLRSINAVSVCEKCLVYYNTNDTNSLTRKVKINTVLDTIEIYKESLEFYYKYGCEENIIEAKVLCRDTLLNATRLIFTSTEFSNDEKEYIYEAVFSDKYVKCVFDGLPKLKLNQRVVLFLSKHHLFYILKILLYIANK